MTRVFYVASREFVATVATKGFVIGLLIAPALILLGVALVPRLLALREAPSIEGEIAIVDPTGEVAAGLRAHLDPAAVAGRRGELVERVLSATELPEQVRRLASGVGRGAADEVMQTALGSVPHLEVSVLPVGVDVEREKTTLIPDDDDDGRLALVIVHDNATTLARAPDPAPAGRYEGRYEPPAGRYEPPAGRYEPPAGRYEPPAGRYEPPAGRYETPAGTYDLFVRRGLDNRIISEIRAGLRDAIIDARVRTAGLDRNLVENLTRVRPPPSIIVTAEEERSRSGAFDQVLPIAFMILLMVSVMTGGQSLLTNTVEEKSNRVVEVLLAAVSPLELMTGKILGQMAVGFVVLGVYIAMGLAALASFALFGLIDAWLIGYLLIFYVVTYLIIGSMMAAVGSAVSELREAQSLMTPFMLLLSAPWMFWWYVAANPDSTFSLVLSFIPPMNGFVILVRLASFSPPPVWQVGLSITVGVLAVFGALWVAAKVFRVGLLMHGKPPNLATLVRWVRMA